MYAAIILTRSRLLHCRIESSSFTIAFSAEARVWPRSQGDVCVPEDCNRAAAGVAAIFHLAAMSKVQAQPSRWLILPLC